MAKVPLVFGLLSPKRKIYLLHQKQNQALAGNEGDLFNDPKHKDMQIKPTNITDVYNYYAEQAGKNTGQARQRAKFATHNTTHTSGSEEQLFIPVDAEQVLLNIEKVKLPQPTQETSRKPIFRIGGESLSLMDFFP
ncbi:unnamed protein product [Allacma fusca]|uniref:Uncharacterized protein n=1 Tax=Allacma fusca TaxID=39272 RepID=A0A8J2P3K1_9HEXA|nr:unnamed protein product [Allacma fusca]